MERITYRQSDCYCGFKRQRKSPRWLWCLIVLFGISSLYVVVHCWSSLERTTSDGIPHHVSQEVLDEYKGIINSVKRSVVDFKTRKRKTLPKETQERLQQELRKATERKVENVNLFRVKMCAFTISSSLWHLAQKLRRLLAFQCQKNNPCFVFTTRSLPAGQD